VNFKKIFCFVNYWIIFHVYIEEMLNNLSLWVGERRLFQRWRAIAFHSRQSHGERQCLR